MRIDIQAVNPKTGKVVSINFDAENTQVLEAMLYDMTLSFAPDTNIEQLEAITKNIACECMKKNSRMNGKESTR